MKIFADFHHEDLYYAIYLLFEGRLGHTLYRPYGEEWHRCGDWKLDPAMAKDLLCGLRPKDGVMKIGTHQTIDEYDGYILASDAKRPRVKYRALRRDQLQEHNIDIYISTIPEHVAVFDSLIRNHHRHAKQIFIAGNAWNLRKINCNNIMHSCKINYSLKNKNSVYFKQEFNTNELFGTPPPANHKSIVNMINNLDDYSDAASTWSQLQARLPEFTYRSYGLENADGFYIGTVADALQDYGFAYYVKHGGEGFGHYAHQAVAMGRPLIVKGNLYKGLTVEDILIPGVSCIDLAGMGTGGVANQLIHISRQQYIDLSNSCSELFKRKINFAAEAAAVSEFLSRLR